VTHPSTDLLTIEGFEIPVTKIDVLIVGAGAAGLNAALHLHALGIEKILLVTESLSLSTSRNAGSDKQTYYKLSLAGQAPDSVAQMAADLVAGGCVHGDIALIEAATSVREFFHLVELGVPFPHDEYGRYAGYRTDNDPRQRASSTGPWTSRNMVDCLLNAVLEKGIPVEEGKLAARLLTRMLKEQTQCLGAILVDLEKDGSPESVSVVLAGDVIWAGGGLGDLFPHSVYPEGLGCGLGVPILAGAVTQNMTEMQFGIASLAPRWNLSGSYQQVIPSYLSTNSSGQDEQPFLEGAFPSPREQARAVFRKGYEWPFDARKLISGGSSRVDELVLEETLKGRRVWLDFTRDPLERNGVFDPGLLPDEARSYLTASDCLLPCPAKRLDRMNRPAVERYIQAGKDISRDRIEIRVSSQHLNGGIRGDLWWQSSLLHLYVVGEANGSHGVSRPGGSALNAGQIGGLRAALHIANRKDKPEPLKRVETVTGQVRNFLADVGKTLRPQGALSPQEVADHTRRFALKAAGPIREPLLAGSGLELARHRWDQLVDGQVTFGERPLWERLRLEALILTFWTVLSSVSEYVEKGGGSRGGFVIQGQGSDSTWLPEDASFREQILETRFNGQDFSATWRPVRPLPIEEPWFETLWQRFREGNIYER